MSRVGKYPVALPQGVTAEVKGQNVAVKGKMGNLALDVPHEVEVKVADGKVAVTMRDLKIKTTNLYNKNAVFSQGFFYTLIATIVFVLPRFIDGFAAEVPQLVSAILFIIGPLSTVVNASPAFAQGCISIRHEPGSMSNRRR